MRITIRQKDVFITQALSRYIENGIIKPVRRMLKENFSGGLNILSLEFSRTSRHHKKGLVFRAEANLAMGSKLIRAEAEAGDMRSACDLLREELEAEIRAFKGKRLTLQKRGARIAKNKLRYSE